MEKPSKIAPATGKLGVLLPGMGAVSTTFMSGVELVRKDQALPVGSLTQMGTIRLGKRTEGRSPLIKEFVPLADLKELSFGGWDIFKDNAYQSAANAGVLNLQDLEKVKPFLSTIKPMKAAFDHDFVKKIDGPNIKKGKNKYELALQIKEDIDNFRKTSRVSRLVTCWCGSTESFVKPEEVHSTPEKFVEAMKSNHPAIAPSMLYAWASVTSGVPYANGSPNLSVDIPAIQTLAHEHNVAICGKDFKTGQTLLKTVLAPAFKARMLAGRMVFDKHSRQPRRRSAGGSGIVQDQGRIQTERAGIHSPAATVSAALRQDASQGAHQLLPTARGQQRRLGQYRHFRLARLRHADQSGLSLPGFHSGRSDRTGSCLVPRSGTARGHARDSGMAQLLLQITHDCAGLVSRA